MSSKVNLADLGEHRGAHTKSNSRWAHDAKGIPLCRVCDECEHLLPKIYRPEVLGTQGRYEDVVEETIEADGADEFDQEYGHDYDCP